MDGIRELRAELLERRDVDQEKLDDLLDGCDVDDDDYRNRSLGHYYKGRIRAYNTAILYINKVGAEIAILELIERREAERSEFEKVKKTGVGGTIPARRKGKAPLPEFYIGRECVFAEAIVLLERLVAGSKSLEAVTA